MQNRFGFIGVDLGGRKKKKRGSSAGDVAKAVYEKGIPDTYNHQRKMES